MTPEQEKIYYDKMEQNFPHFLSAMEKLVAIPSYLEEDTYPQVTSLHEVLAATLELLQEMGYKTYADPEGYYGYAEIGQGDKLIGILGHLDVVPPGMLDDWKHGNTLAKGSLHKIAGFQFRNRLFCC